MEKRDKHTEGMSDLEGTPCFHYPGGEYDTGTTTRTLEDGDTVLVVKEVPALVCDKFGDAAFSEKVAERLETLITEAATAGVQSEIRHWQASRVEVA